MGYEDYNNDFESEATIGGIKLKDYDAAVQRRVARKTRMATYGINERLARQEQRSHFRRQFVYTVTTGVLALGLLAGFRKGIIHSPFAVSAATPKGAATVAGALLDCIPEYNPDIPFGNPFWASEEDHQKVDVEMTQGYGVGTHAPGDIWGAVDLVPQGSDTIHATVRGIVHLTTVQQAPAYGNSVVIEGKDYDTYDGHVTKFLVQDGDQVEPGDPIAEAGSTGSESTGKHDHHEVRDRSKKNSGGTFVRVDPTDFGAVDQVIRTKENSCKPNPAVANDGQPNVLQRFGNWLVSVPGRIKDILGTPEGNLRADSVSHSSNELGSNVDCSGVKSGELCILSDESSISAENIERVLQKYDSPAVGTGKMWIELGRKYGIDPAFALAFFEQESTFGAASGWAGRKPDGTTTHNIGNVTCAGYKTCFGRFRDYTSWEEGIEDWYKVIKEGYVNKGSRTPQDILPIYTPFGDGDNNPTVYATRVTERVLKWRNGDFS